MLRSFSFLAGTLLLAAAPVVAGTREGEAKLAEALEGRIAGEPVACINLRTVRSSEAIKDPAILYKSGATPSANRPPAGARPEAHTPALWSQMRTSIARLCLHKK